MDGDMLLKYLSFIQEYDLFNYHVGRRALLYTTPNVSGRRDADRRWYFPASWSALHYFSPPHAPEENAEGMSARRAISRRCFAEMMNVGFGGCRRHAAERSYTRALQILISFACWWLKMRAMGYCEADEISRCFTPFYTADEIGSSTL